VRRQLGAIITLKIERVKAYITEVDRFRSNYKTMAKFTPNMPFDEWKQQFLSEISTLPFGKQLASLQRMVNPRKAFPKSLFYSRYGHTRLIKLCSHLDYKVKDLINRANKLGYMVLHHSIHQNPECMAVITSLKSSDYFEAFRVLEKRFGAFQDTEKRKLQSVYANMRIQRGQSFRDFYGKIQDVVHKLNYHHGVTVYVDWLNHKISSNIPEAFRAYFYSIQHECLDPDTLVTRILELEDLTLQNSPVPASVNFTPETNHNQSRYRGRCGNCGNHRHHRRDCPLPKQHRNSKKNQQSKNWRSQNAKPEPPHNQNDKDRQNHNTKRDSNDGSSNRDQNHYIQNNQNFGNRKRNGSDLPSGRNTRANHVFLKNQGTSNLFYKMKHLKYSPYVCLTSQNTIPRKKEPQRKFCSEGSNVFVFFKSSCYVTQDIHTGKHW